MGTRSLITVIKDGEYKVAQYSQWDGYLSGVGADLLNFLEVASNIKLLGEKLDRVRFLTKQEAEYYNETPLSERTEDQKEWVKLFIHRDVGADILANIANSKRREILLADATEFADDALFCEYAYCIDMDKGLFELYSGGGSSERFKNLDLLAVFRLDRLPSADELTTLEDAGEY